VSAPGAALADPAPPLVDGLVALRPWSQGDISLLAAAAADEYVALIEGLPPPDDAAAAGRWIERKRAFRADGRGWELAVLARATGEAVGGVGLGLRHPPGTAEPGVWIAPELRDSGFATHAVALVCDWALGPQTGIERIQATVHPWNAAAQHVLERLGFVREGRLRGYTSYRGAREDVLLYALLPGELRRPA